MFWLSYECFSILCDAFLLKSVISSHYSCLCVTLYKAARSSPKCVWKNPTRQIQRNVKNINWYSSYESSKTGKCNTFLVSFITLFDGNNDSCLASLRGARYFEDYTSNHAKICKDVVAGLIYFSKKVVKTGIKVENLELHIFVNFYKRANH